MGCYSLFSTIATKKYVVLGTGIRDQMILNLYFQKQVVNSSEIKYEKKEYLKDEQSNFIEIKKLYISLYVNKEKKGKHALFLPFRFYIQNNKLPIFTDIYIYIYIYRSNKKLF